MTNKDLIELLQQFPPDTEVAIFDYKKNFDNDLGDGSPLGIYPEFQVALVESNEPGREINFTPWIAISFANEEWEGERTCRVCGCTDYNCQQCIERTGSPCHWVEDDLCSACVEKTSNILLPGRDFLI